GPSLMSGYLGHERLVGAFDTGDLGFLMDGELYITGRTKEIIIRGGVNISPHQGEWPGAEALDLRHGQVVAFSHMDALQGREELVVVVGKSPEEHLRSEIEQEVSRVVSDQAGVQIDRILFLASDQLARTTSGKVQRGVVRSRYVAGELGNSGG